MVFALLSIASSIVLGIDFLRNALLGHGTCTAKGARTHSAGFGAEGHTARQGVFKDLPSLHREGKGREGGREGGSRKGEWNQER